MTKPAAPPGPLDRAVPMVLVPILFVCVLAAPAWSWFDALSTPHARGDDFVYLAGAVTGPDLARSLFTPHNAHVVPIFRAWVRLVVLAAGSLAAVPRVMMISSYFVFVTAILGVGHLVAWESRSLFRALVAMGVVGVSSVLAPTVAWFSAGQALMAGSAALAMLEAFQLWRIDGRRIWIGIGTAIAFAAPWIWSGGYVAGAAGAAYLWLDGRPGTRRLAPLPFAASVLTLVLSVGIAGRQMFTPESGAASGGMNPAAGAVRTAQAVPEILVAANLGLDAPTTPLQGLALSAATAVLWAGSRGWRFKPSPLEGAGAVLILGGFGLAYTFRSQYGFDSLRGIFWYQAIPQLGLGLFVAGWIASARGDAVGPGIPRRPTWRQAAVVPAVLVFALATQAPRTARAFLEHIPKLDARGMELWPTPELRLARGRYLAAERVARQGRLLSRLDLAAKTAKAANLSRRTLREAFGRVLGPAMPAHVLDVDAVSLLPLPDAGGPPLDPRTRAALAELIRAEPAAKPPGLRPEESWDGREW